MGADAVIGVDLEYSEFSGGGKSMLFLAASGTAVIADTQNAQSQHAPTQSRRQENG
ncbi:MAG: heavy metal-binding domain-containing protein [Gammaproteobacteria bacterium]|nr:heavy metal-binding domain-containing protein [Gammaproteobacteria bacterium]